MLAGKEINKAGYISKDLQSKGRGGEKYLELVIDPKDLWPRAFNSAPSFN